MNSKEALERLKEETQPNAYTLNHNDEDFAIIEKALDRLEKFAQENASLHTEIASLQSENEIWKKAIENSNKAYDVLMQNSNIQFLNQNQEIFKLKKVIEILKNKKPNLFTYFRNKKIYTENFVNRDLTQEEYDLLKEYLDDK